MKRRLLCAAAALMLTGLICSCANAPAMSGNDGRLHIVSAVFAGYDWAKNITGGGTDIAEIKLLNDNGVDIHSYNPSAEDMIKVASCDVFIYTGGSSDGWVRDTLKNSVNGDMKVICFTDILSERLKTEETVEGMQPEHGGEDEDEYDEHVWLSPVNAEILCDAIADALCGADPDNSARYRANAEEYKKKLEKLDGEFRDTVKNARLGAIVVADRFPFRYLTDEYGLSYSAAFNGCSAETEASFDTVIYLANKADGLGAKALITTESSDKRIAEAVRQNTKNKDQDIVALNSMQSVTANDIKNGINYLSLMEDNVKALGTALE